MLEFKVPVTRFAEAWCLKNIGPRMFYLHNSIGGDGWRILRRDGHNYVCIEDDKKALMAMLTLGDKNE